MEQNPCDRVEPIAGARRLPRPIPAGDPRSEVSRTIATAPPPYRLIFTLLRETGMRVGEALHLNLGDVALEPTTNRRARVASGVRWRKGCYGTQSVSLVAVLSRPGSP